MISELTPKNIVDELNKYIVGQDQAKRAVAIALRNRFRRMQVSAELRPEITPKNILMIGPTGVGKTEIARRLASLAGAPFIKVEATKYTEVGYVGRDVESIIRDLVDRAIKMVRMGEMARVSERAIRSAEDRILDALLPRSMNKFTFSKETDDKNISQDSVVDPVTDPEPDHHHSTTREKFREKLHSGELDNEEIEIELSVNPVGVEIMAPPGMEEMTNQLQGLFQNLSSDRKKRKKLKVKDARKILRDDEASKLLNEDEIRAKALEKVEQSGIVFIDEMDKVTRRSDQHMGGGDVSREGVQRDLLPLIEGTTVSTRYGTVKTDHVLFIASGAFHLSKPSDLIPELQGRLPIRVELDALTAGNFVQILTEPQASLTKQYQALLETEGVKLSFIESGIAKIAEIAFSVNEKTENIGARRLHTVMERLLEEISFDAEKYSGQTVEVTREYVEKQLNVFLKDEDLSHFIL